MEQYDGTLGVTTDWVDEHQGPVGYHLNAGCSGTLISRDLFLSAGHCGYAVGHTVRFNYQDNPIGNPRPTQDHTVIEVVEQQNTVLWDYAIVRLDDAPGLDFGHARLADRDPAVGSLVALIQHPAGMPKGIHAGPVVDYASGLGSNWFRHQVDTTGGSSGSGVLSADGMLVGVHTNAGCLTGPDPQGNSAIRMTRLLQHSATLREVQAADTEASIAFHRPGGPWSSIPVLYADGDGTWSSSNAAVPSWANDTNVRAIRGDYDGDGRFDIAFHRPGSAWNSVPILMSSGDGQWDSFNSAAPSWANQPNVVAIPGDFDDDGRSDIAFHRPGSGWNSVPVLFSNGDGTWSSTNLAAPSWANQPGVIAIPGNFDSDGDTDIAFHRPGSAWNSVPVLLSDGDGSWSSTNPAVPSWANESGARAVAGDFNGDGETDIAIHRPGSGTTLVPILRATGAGTWSSQYTGAPSWANQTGTEAIVGDFDADGDSDIAFHRPGGPWNTVPVLLGGAVGWGSANNAAPSWANQTDVVGVAGDYDGDGRDDLAFHRPGGGWNSVPVLFAQGSGVWSSANSAAPAWANQPGVTALP